MEVPLRICFPLKGHEICFDVPTLKPNPPGPHPEPWIQGIEIPLQDLAHLQQLSTIAEIVETMPAAMQDVFVAPMAQAIAVHANKVNGAVFNWHRGGPGPDPATLHR